MALLSFSVAAAPQGGEIVSGEGNIQTPDTQTTVVIQDSQNLSINWDSFNLSRDEQVTFIQPGRESTALNYIFDQQPTEIFGRIDANGRVFIMNPNGVLFGESARINVGGLVAGAFQLDYESLQQTSLLDNYDLLIGDGSVNNAGVISVEEGGSVVLVGNTVKNEGEIIARFGTIHLVSADAATLSFDADGLVRFSITDKTLEDSYGVGTAIENTGKLIADGGTVVLKAAAANDVFSNVINNTGLIQATRISNVGGVVRLEGSGGNVINTGTIDVSGSSDSTGGTASIFGDRVGILDGSIIDASGGQGGGNVYIGGLRKGAGELVSEFTQVSSNTTINADAISNGDGGEVVIWADDTTWAYGQVSAKGGVESGDGGFVEISGKQGLVLQAEVDVTATNGQWGTLLLDPTDITIHDQADGVQGDDGALPDLSNATAGTGTFDIGELALEGLAGTANLVLEATNNITMNDLADNVLALNINTGGSIIITADTDLDGAGSFVMDTGDTISTQGGSIDITAAGVTLGTLNTDGPAASDGAITVSSTASASIEVSTAGTEDISIAIDTDANGTDTLTLGGSLIGGTISLQGGADGGDTLIGPDQNNTWVVSALDTGTLNGWSFSSFPNLTGGSADDSFSQTGVGSITGTYDGGAFTIGNTVDYSGYSGVINAVINGNFTNIQTVIGKGADSTLVADNVVNTWTITGVNDGTVGTLAFTDFSILTGGTDNDSFVLSGGSTSGTISGGAGTDTLTGNNIDSNWSILGADSGTVDGVFAFTGIENLIGGTGDDAFILSVGSISGTIDGGAGTDSLSPDNVVNTWAITGADAGTVTGVGGFTNIENLFGRTNGDDFTFADGASISGTLDGGGGTDSVDLSAQTAAVLVNLSGTDYANIEQFIGNGTDSTLVGDSDITPNVWNITGADDGTLDAIIFVNFTDLTGGTDADTFTLAGGTVSGIIDGGGGSDTLVGDNVNNSWSIATADAGDVTGIGSFTDIDSLTGGNDVDTFIFADGSSLSGSVDGGAGNDIVDFTNETGAVVIGLGSSGYANVETFVGNDIDSTIIGDNIVNNWVINGPNDGTIAGTSFIDFNNITGGTDDDTFDLSGGTVSGILDGNGGNNTLFGDLLSNTWNITGADAGNIDLTNYFTGIENLTGNASTDDFVFANVGTLSGIINAASGSDSVDFSAKLGTVSVDLTGSNYNSVETFTGNDIDSTIVGPTSITLWTISGANSGTVNTFNFAGFNNLDGNTNADTFTLTGGSISGLINGGAGNDVINGVNTGAVWNITGVDVGNLTNVNVFSNIETLSGGNGVDTFIFANASSFSGVINGGVGSDAVDQSAQLGAVSIDLSASNYQNIESFIGNGIDSTMNGSNIANAWSITAADTGDVNGILFSGFNNLVGNNQQDQFTLNGGTISGSIDGVAGSDEIVADNIANTWNITAADTGVITGVNSFTRIDNLTGGTGDDYYIFDDTSTLSGLIDGGAGNDTVDLSAESGVVNITIGTAGYSNVEAFIGNNTASTITGPLAVNSWNIAGNNDGTVAGVSFTNFNNITGNVDSDTFVFQNGSVITGDVNGGAGSDEADFSAETGVVSIQIGSTEYANIESFIGNNTSSTITGGNFANTWVITGANTGTVGAIDYSGFNNLTGNANVDTFTLNGGTITGTIDGGLNNDSLTPDNVVNTWSITAADTGSVTGVNNFTSIENINGNASADAFIFSDGSSISGLVDGAGGADSADQSAQSGFVNVVLGSAGFDNIETFTGNGSNSTLTGDNVLNTWLITGVDSGTVGITTFSGFSNFQGGSNDDSFTLNGGSVTGQLDGGIGNDLILADNVVNNWSITGVDVGGLTGINAFSGIETLQGNSNIDNFVFSSGASFSGVVDGVGNNDVVDFSSGGGAIVVSLATGQYQNIESFVGDSTNSTLIGPNSTNDWLITGSNSGDVNGINFSGFNNITGNVSADTFTLQAGIITGVVDGGTGNDSIQADNISNTWTISAADSGSVNGIAAFQDIDNLLGGTAADVFNIDANVSGNINGGAGGDTYNLGGLFTVGGTMDGGSGFDTINGPVQNSSWVISGSNTGIVNSISFANTENLTGGVGQDTFTINNTATAEVTGTMTGGNGDDTLIVDYNLASTRVITFAGGAGTDTLSLTGSGANMTNSYTYGPASGSVSVISSSGATSQTVNATEMEGVTDIMTADNISLVGSSNDDVMVLSPGAVAGMWPTSFQIASLLPLEFSNKSNIFIDGALGTDSLRIDGTNVFPGNVEITAEVITEGAGGLLGADILTINQASTIGSSGNELETNVNTLIVTGSTDDLYINEANGLALSAAGVSGVLDVSTVSGDITSAGSITVTGLSSFSVGNGGSIILDDAGNQFTGTPVFSSAGTITDLYLVDNSAVDIQGLSLNGNLSIFSNGPISQSGALSVQGNSIFSSGSNFINLNTASNDFVGTVTLLNSGSSSVAISDVNAINFNASSLGSGAFTVIAGSISQSGEIVQAANAGATTLIASNGSIDLNNGLNDFTGIVNVTNTSSNNDVTIFDRNSFSLGSSSTNGGDLLVNAVRDVTLSGTTISNDGDITIVSDTGDIQLGRLNAGLGKITLNATTGNVVGNDSPINDPNLSSQDLEIIAGQGIGDFSNPISVNVPSNGTSLIVAGLPPAYIIGSVGTVLSGSSFVNNVTSTTFAISQGQSVSFVGHELMSAESIYLPLFTMVDGGIKLPYRISDYSYNHEELEQEKLKKDKIK